MCPCSWLSRVFYAPAGFAVFELYLLQDFVLLCQFQGQSLSSLCRRDSFKSSFRRASFKTLLPSISFRGSFIVSTTWPSCVWCDGLRTKLWASYLLQLFKWGRLRTWGHLETSNGEANFMRVKFSKCQVSYFELVHCLEPILDVTAHQYFSKITHLLA